MRVEKDPIGELKIARNAYYGIHAWRSKTNFPDSGERVNPYLIKAYFLVKKASLTANHETGIMPREKFDKIESAIDLLIAEVDKFLEENDSEIYSMIIVDPYQGGAGTSLNMNINEVIANKTLELMDEELGSYHIIHPLDDINMSQSTNDTYPTALKIASIILLRQLESSFAALQGALQQKEHQFKSIIKLGRTQYQDAVPVTLGQEFGAYAQAIGRDRWRLYNAEERLRSVNLGGTAIGNSIAAPKEYVLSVNNILNKLTGLPIAKGEDLIDTTQNLDVFVEVHGIVKAGAVSVQKICNDLRFLSSGPDGGISEINLPPMQAGSSIMPGKVNPVILENAIQITEIVKADDLIISNMSGAGHLELNAFVPVIAHSLLKSFSMLKDANINLAEKCIEGITANKEVCKKHLLASTAIAACLIPHFGYDTIQDISKKARETNTPFIDALIKSELAEEEKIMEIIFKETGAKIE